MPGEGSTAGLWARLELGTEHVPWRDFEVQRVAPGEIYLLAFVSEEAGRLFAALDPEPVFEPALPVEAHAWWQIWKKKPEPPPLELRQGVILTLHPDLNPEASCAVALPLARLEPVAVREVRAGLSHLVQTLEVRLR